MKKRDTELHIIFVDGYMPKIEVKGTVNDILIAWGWLTLAICDRFGVSVDKLADKMPWVVGRLRKSMSHAVAIDLETLQEQREEGGSQ